MSDYEATHKAGWANVPEPQVLPDGHYQVKFDALFFNVSKEKGTEYLSLRVTAEKPLPDVDKGSLKALGDDYDLSANEVYNGGDTFLGLNGAKATRRTVKILGAFGVSSDEMAQFALDIEDDEGNKRVNPEIVKMFRGKSAIAKIKSETWKGEERNVASDFAPVAK